MRLSVDAQRPEEDSVAEAARILHGHGVVAYPTETFYALGARALDPVGCDRIFEIKGRMRDKAFPCIVSDLEQVNELASEIPWVVTRLAERFWPGPLTIVLRAKAGVAAASSEGTVAVRVSAHPLARKLAAAAGPVTATSANLSGCPPTTTASGVEVALGARVDLLLDGGESPGGLASTIVSAGASDVSLLRRGPIPFESVRQALKS